MSTECVFPDGFVWGAATSAYQIEGASDSRETSIWDDFCRTPGKIANSDHGDHASRHAEFLAEDISIISRMGLDAYRFSLSWPRLVSTGDGEGKVSREGIAFYDRLIDELLNVGCTPYCTLYHWDLPSTLQAKGGWLSPESPAWFERYAEIAAKHFGDRVRDWFTLNEPQVFLQLGMATGEHAPGMKADIGEVVLASHHVVLAHGRAARAIREHAPGARVGIAPVGVVGMPNTGSQADIDAARAYTMGVSEPGMWNNTWHLDPIAFGRYPEDGMKIMGEHLPENHQAELEEVRAPIDMLGLNIYSGVRVRADAAGKPEAVAAPMGIARTSFGWSVEPSTLYWGPRFLQERYKVPIYITENGLANNDWVMLDGRVHDEPRIDFTTRYLAELHRASTDGVDIRGYFHWSLLDNFEWAEGYAKRFGMVHVDMQTGTRTLKESAHWYARVIEANGFIMPDGGTARPAADSSADKPAAVAQA